MPESHTPGPWAIHPDFRTTVVPASDTKKKVGGCIDPDTEASEYAKVICNQMGNRYPEYHRSRVSPEEARANAQLIAAAPDLLVALEALAKAAFMATCEDDAGLHHLDGSLIDAAWKSIRKAKGKE